MTDGGASLAKELKAKADNVDAYSASLPKMHEGGTVPKDWDYKLLAGEHVTPAPKKAEGRDSEYRRVFMARGAAGLHNFGTKAAPEAKEQTRQDGGNTPVKGEKHEKGEEHLKA